MTILESGQRESLKGTVHASLGTLAALCTLYNAAAFLQRRQAHLAVNAVLYGLLTGWEAVKVQHHWTTRAGARVTTDAGS